MEPVYIIMICAGGIFFLLLLSYILYAIELKKKRKKLKNHLSKAYAEENLTKMEYDIAFYDDETFKRIRASKASDSQMTIDDVITEHAETGEQPEMESKFNKFDSEGVEEITGNYKPKS